jgi:hypothetical protein
MCLVANHAYAIACSLQNASFVERLRELIYEDIDAERLIAVRISQIGLIFTVKVVSFVVGCKLCTAKRFRSELDE